MKTAILFLVLCAHGAYADSPKCQSDFILQHYKSCIDPSHPPIYREKSSPACPLIYQTCHFRENKGDREEVAIRTRFSVHWLPTALVSNHWTRLKPNDTFGLCWGGAMKENYGVYRLNKSRLNALWVARGEAQWLSPDPLTRQDILDDVKIRQDSNTDIASAISIFDFSSFKPRHISRLSLADVWQTGHAMTFKFISGPFFDASGWAIVECELEETVSIPPSAPNPQCGATGFETCRAKEHDIETYENLATKECGTDPAGIWTERNPQFDKPERKVTCATEDAMPEKKPEEIQAKIAELKTNLQLLSSVPANSAAVGKLGILLELQRLDSSSSLKPQIQALLSTYHLDGSLNDAIKQAVDEKRLSLVKGTLDLFPDLAKSVRAQYAPDFIAMDDDSYLTLFPEGLVLDSDGLKLLKIKIKSVEGESAYRAAEVLVRSSLTQTQSQEKQIINLISLNSTMQGDKDNLAAISQSATTALALSPAEAQALSEEIKSYHSDIARTKASLGKFINDRIAILEREKDHALAALWRSVESLHQLKEDPRFAVLDAYRALVQVDAPAFSEAMSVALANVKNNKDPALAQYSLRLLTSDARANLHGLRALQQLLQNVETQKSGIRDSLVMQINQTLGHS